MKEYSISQIIEAFNTNNVDDELLCFLRKKTNDGSFLESWFLSIACYYGRGIKDVNLAHKLWGKNSEVLSPSPVNLLYTLNKSIYGYDHVIILFENEFTYKILLSCIQNNLNISGFYDSSNKSAIFDCFYKKYDMLSIPKNSAGVVHYSLLPYISDTLKNKFEMIYVYDFNRTSMPHNLFELSAKINETDVVIIGEPCMSWDIRTRLTLMDINVSHVLETPSGDTSHIYDILKVTCGHDTTIVIEHKNWKEIYFDLLKYGYSKNQIFVDLVKYENYNYHYLYGDFKTISLSEICYNFKLGKKIYHDFANNPQKTYLICDWSAVGDTYKFASLIKSFKDEHNVSHACAVVVDFYKGISEFFNSIDEEVLLSYEEMMGLRFYFYFKMEYKTDNIMFFGKRVFCGINPYAHSLVINSNYFKSIKELMEVSMHSEYQPLSIPYAKRSVKLNSILINPYGHWTYSKYPHLESNLWDFFDRISESLVKKGYVVYTNCSSIEQRALKDSIPLVLPLNSIIRQLPYFKYAISIVTGFAELLEMSLCKVSVIYPALDLIDIIDYRDLVTNSNLDLVFYDISDEEQLLNAIIEKINDEAKL